MSQEEQRRAYEAAELKSDDQIFNLSQLRAVHRDWIFTELCLSHPPHQDPMTGCSASGDFPACPGRRKPMNSDGTKIWELKSAAPETRRHFIRPSRRPASRNHELLLKFFSSMKPLSARQPLSDGARYGSTSSSFPSSTRVQVLEAVKSHHQTAPARIDKSGLSWKNLILFGLEILHKHGSLKKR